MRILLTLWKLLAAVSFGILWGVAVAACGGPVFVQWLACGVAFGVTMNSRS